ncbi:MAG: ABC transporter permease [Chlamydiae bacterium]|nr:ABC transporter permease [Chlamydiota bacterium]
MSFGKYFFKKILICYGSLFVVISLTFILMKSIPGDPFISEENMPKEVLDSLYRYYGLDKPIYIQYFEYIKGFLTFDLGPSMVYEGRRVNQIITESFPISFALGAQALFLAFFLGTIFGAIAAFKKDKWQDNLFMIFAVLGISVPSFLLASCLQYVFAMKLSLLPIARWGTFAHTILPTISLAALPTAFIAKLTRGSLLEVLAQDYIKTAKAKGLNPFRVFFFHTLRNGILPVISYLGSISANLLTGSFVVEKIFGIPGLGQWLILSISNRDYPVIFGITVFLSFILITIIFVVDILYSFIDPRIKKEYASKNF